MNQIIPKLFPVIPVIPYMSESWLTIFKLSEYQKNPLKKSKGNFLK